MIRKTLFWTLLFSNAAAQGGGYLGEDNAVHVIAPSGFFPQKNLDRIEGHLKNLGLKPIIPGDLLKEGDIMGYANTERYRSNHLESLLVSDDCNVIWAGRGGRGCSDLLESLKYVTSKSPKLFVGFSDITALHLYAQYKNWPSLHGCVLNLNKEMESPSVNSKVPLQTIKDILDGSTTKLSYTLSPLNKRAKIESVMKGTSVCGGNLSLIQRSIGTYTQLDTEGKILLLEDIGEDATKVNESLTHLGRAGLFDKAVGVIWGNFCPHEKELEKYEWLKTKFADQLDEMTIPLFTSDRFGHGSYNDPVMFNTPTKVVVDGGDDVKITIETMRE